MHVRAHYRNLLLISLAASMAAESGASHLALAISRQNTQNSDTSLPFLRHAEALLHVLDPPISLLTPLAHISAAQVVQLGEGVGAPWELTWSCVKGGEVHCGECVPCLQRIEALQVVK